MGVTWLFLLLSVRSSWESRDGRTWKTDGVGVSYPVAGFSPLSWGQGGWSLEGLLAWPQGPDQLGLNSPVNA